MGRAKEALRFVHLERSASIRKAAFPLEADQKRGSASPRGRFLPFGIFRTKRFGQRVPTIGGSASFPEATEVLPQKDRPRPGECAGPGRSASILESPGPAIGFRLGSTSLWENWKKVAGLGEALSLDLTVPAEALRPEGAENPIGWKTTFRAEALRPGGRFLPFGISERSASVAATG